MSCKNTTDTDVYSCISRNLDRSKHFLFYIHIFKFAIDRYFSVDSKTYKIHLWKVDLYSKSYNILKFRTQKKKKATEAVGGHI